MRNKALFVNVILIVLACAACEKQGESPGPPSPESSPQQETMTPKEIIAKVDQTMYYPQKEGLRRLRARVESPWIEAGLEQKKKLHPEQAEFWDSLEVQVFFEYDSVLGPRYVVQGIPEDMASTRRSLEEIFKGTEIIMIPRPQAEMFRDFLVVAKAEGEEIRVVGTNPESNFYKYILTVDRQFRIKRYEFYTGSHYSRTYVTLQKIDGKHVITRLLTEQTLSSAEESPAKKRPAAETGRKPTSETEVTIEYQNVGGLYLAKEFVYTIKQAATGELMQDPLEVRFEDLQVNAGQPGDTSPSPPGKQK